MSMATPYATIIVPIVDRAETLAISLETRACAGSAGYRAADRLFRCIVRSPQVRPCLRASRCSRSRAGLALQPGQHCERAGGSAPLDRILILQDDDLWFPHHVTTLGAMLDDADFATFQRSMVTPLDWELKRLADFEPIFVKRMNAARRSFCDA